jgi:hypothetical protein
MQDIDFINMKELDVIATRDYLPITLPRQLKFTTTQQVVDYVNTHSGNNGSRTNYLPVTVPANLLTSMNGDQISAYKRAHGGNDLISSLATMMEAFFGHYSTCRLSHKDLVVMWGRVFKDLVNRLYNQNRSLPRVGDDNLEDCVRIGKERIKEEFRNDKIELARRLDTFEAHYRTRGEIITLVTKFSFNAASRFFVMPLHLDPLTIEQYATLRLDMIKTWYDDLSGNDISALRLVSPYRYFGTLDPKTTAFRLFKPDLYVDFRELKRRKTVFTRWWKRESVSAIQAAVGSQDFDYIDHVRYNWDEAKLYSDQLYQALVPRSKLFDAGEAGFIDNKEYVDAPNMHEELDNKRLESEIKNLAGTLKHTNVIDEKAAESSGDYDAYVTNALRNSDLRTKKKERRFRRSGLGDKVDEKDDMDLTSSEDESETDNTMDVEDTSGNAYINMVNKRF